MPGPVPKDVKLKQRRNKATTRRTFDRGKARRKYAPRLPDGAWHELTRAWWHDVWHSPMAEAYLDVDRHALFRLALLVDMYYKAPVKELAAEIRLEQQAFGLTPVDRRRLEWSVEAISEAGRFRDGIGAEERGRVRTARPEAEAEDPRKILKLVAVG